MTGWVEKSNADSTRTMPFGPSMTDPERKRLMHARHAGGFFCELVKYVTRSQQSPFDDPNLAAFSKESDKEGASIDFRSGRLEKNKGI